MEVKVTKDSNKKLLYDGLRDFLHHVLMVDKHWSEAKTDAEREALISAMAVFIIEELIPTWIMVVVSEKESGPESGAGPDGEKPKGPLH